MLYFHFTLEPFVQKFCIYGLFGYKNIEIDFKEPFKILVGENGSGKTTILNCLYYTLKKKFEPLSKVRFDKIKISFSHNKSLEFEKYEVEAFVEAEYEFQNTPFYRSLSQQLSAKDIESLSRLIYSDRTEAEQTKAILMYTRKLGFDFKTPSSYMYKNVKRLVNEFLSMRLAHRLEVLDDVLKSKVLYFPTYRRVESAFGNFEEINKKLAETNPFWERVDLKNLFQDEQIQFGMDDVLMSIRKITSEIYKKTMDGFGVIMGDMLSLLSKPTHKDVVKYNFDKKVIQIILDRLSFIKNFISYYFSIVCSGNRFDPRFLSRQRDLIELSDMAMSNDLGTHIGYIVALNGPHYMFKQKVELNLAYEDAKIVTDLHNIQSDIDKGRNEIQQVFNKYRQKITEEQRNVLAVIGG